MAPDVVVVPESSSLPLKFDVELDVEEPDELTSSGVLPVVNPPEVCENEEPTLDWLTVSVPPVVVLDRGVVLVDTLLSEVLEYLSVEP